MSILGAAYKVLPAERRPMSAEELARRCILKKFDVNAPRTELAGLLKVGYADRTVEARMAEHYLKKLPDGTLPYRVEFGIIVAKRTFSTER